jgi:hypothetical protein
MKVFTIIFSVVTIGLVVFNLTKVNYNAPFEGDSTTALIVSFLSLCALLLIWILYTSKQIAKKAKFKK